MAKHLAYKPTNIPIRQSDWSGWLLEQFRSIATALSYPRIDRIGFVVLHVEPTRPEIGTLVYADGTDWNPGAGEGLYQYTSTGWQKP
jgi:hypothetical protein